MLALALALALASLPPAATTCCRTVCAPGFVHHDGDCTPHEFCQTPMLLATTVTFACQSTEPVPDRRLPGGAALYEYEISLAPVTTEEIEAVDQLRQYEYRRGTRMRAAYMPSEIAALESVTDDCASGLVAWELTGWWGREIARGAQTFSFALLDVAPCSVRLNIERNEGANITFPALTLDNCPSTPDVLSVQSKLVDPTAYCYARGQRVACDPYAASFHRYWPNSFICVDHPAEVRRILTTGEDMAWLEAYTFDEVTMSYTYNDDVWPTGITAGCHAFACEPRA